MKTKQFILASLLAASSALQAASAERKLPAPMPEFKTSEQLAKWREENAKANATTESTAKATNASAFFTGKPYLKETGAYSFLFRNYDPEMNRWTTTDPSGFPDWPNNYLYSPNPISGLDPDGLAWGILDYSWHYVFGGGAPVTLSQIGHLSSVKAHFSFQGAIQRFGDQLTSKAASLAPYNGTFKYWTHNI